MKRRGFAGNKWADAATGQRKLASQSQIIADVVDRLPGQAGNEA